MSKVKSANENNCAKAGEIYVNKQGCKYKVIKKISDKKVRIKFLDEYGSEKDIDVYNIKRYGGVRNPYMKKGKGCTGNVRGLNITYKERKKWKSLLSLKEASYKEDWNCLEFFIKDIRSMNIENYDLWLNANSSKEKVYLNAIIENGEIVGFKVDQESCRAKKVIVKSIIDGKEEEFKSLLDAGEKLGYDFGTISYYCKQNRVVDGYRYSFK